MVSKNSRITVSASTAPPFDPEYLSRAHRLAGLGAAATLNDRRCELLVAKREDWRAPRNFL